MGNNENGRAFASRLKESRVAHGWTRGRLDREARLPNGSVNAYEEQGREPTLRNLRTLAAALDVSVATLVGE